MSRAPRPRLGALRRARWRDGNRVRLLENGEGFFEAAFAAIDAAQREVLLETFILFEDKVGTRLHACLVAAAKRGVRVDVLVDGFGSPGFSDAFLKELGDAGVRLHVFDPHRPLLGMRLHIFRRMHRKILVVDAERAFVGGINYSADHLEDYGPEAKQDYAVELTGPIVADIHEFTCDSAQLPREARLQPPRAATGDASVMFAARDNRSRRRDIELHYRHAVRGAQRSIVIANAYFFPSYGLLRELRRASRRGVEVTLILQGRPDEPLAMWAGRSLYRYLLRAGVRVFEYGRRPFHGKVALVDDDWATVGSSNLDPLSLSLNLEANVFIRDAAFNRTLRERLLALREAHCERMQADRLPRASVWQALIAPFAFTVVRRFPRWAGLLPAHQPVRRPLQAAGHE